MERREISHLTLLLLLLLLFTQVSAMLVPSSSGLFKLWPLPQEIESGEEELLISFPGFTFIASGFSDQTLLNAFKRYEAIIFADSRKAAAVKKGITFLEVSVSTSDTTLQLGADESYHLTLEGEKGENLLQAQTIWGAIRGLETFSQLVILQAGRYVIQRTPLKINDFPRFLHRGLLIDSSRNFLPVPTIKRTIDGLAFTKMNVLHWHIVDSQSFPFTSKSFPLLSEKGAYSPEETYSEAEIRDIVSYAYERGVRIIPEFDGPGHSYAWGLGYPNITICPDFRPWSTYCLQPPCGQLDPSNEFTYDLLKGLLRDVTDLFPENLIHLGADEVNFPCWQTSESLTKWMAENGMTTYEQVLQYYITRISQIAQSLNKPTIFWQEVFSADLEISPETIIQVWLDFSTLRKVVDAGYRAILSNHQAWYLDCGFGNWLTGGDNSWCDPHKGWKTMYENDPAPRGSDLNESLVLGGEACLWGESNDDTTIDNKAWPRAAAVGERLWSNRNVTDIDSAFVRLDAHRERLVKRGINAAILRPKWCSIDPTNCPPL